MHLCSVDLFTAYVIKKLHAHCGNGSTALDGVPPVYPPLFKQTTKITRKTDFHKELFVCDCHWTGIVLILCLCILNKARDHR